MRFRFAPTSNIEKRESFLSFCESVAALATRSPPLPEVTPRTELHQGLFVRHRPPRKAVVVRLRSDVSRAAPDEELSLVCDVDLGVGAVDLLRDDASTLQAGNLYKLFKFHCWPPFGFWWSW